MCGAVRWHGSGELIYRMVCHCRSCRRSVGANGVAYATFRTDRFAIAGETLKRYASSAPVVRTFCAECGTALTYEHHERPGEIDVTLASLDDPSHIEPSGHIWMSDAAPWERRAHELPFYERYPGAKQ